MGSLCVLTANEGNAASVIRRSEPEDMPQPVIRENAPCLTWQHLTVATRSSRREQSSKQLLNCVCGTIQGGLWAVLGPSGSGKTTFLSALSLRLDLYRMTQTGLLMLNGRTYTRRMLKSMSGYVMQDDLVNPYMTVAETLSYAAELRMPQDSSAAQRDEMCAHVLDLVGISHCADVLVGDTRVKGISGGERKRLCIAVELLTKPRLLFLDEPTSGLDSATAFSVVRLLKGLTAAARFPTTVVMTLHQPQSKIFATFDNLILMRKGDMVYQGAAGRAQEYFASLGYPCPMHCNPADHMLDVLTGAEVKLPDDDDVDKTCGAGDGKNAVPTATSTATATAAAAAAVTVAEDSADVRAASASSGSSDHFVDVEMVDERYACTLESSSSLSLLPKFIALADTVAGCNQPEFQAHEFPAWNRQFFILFRRSMHLHLRRYDIILINVIVTMLLSTFVSMSTWHNLGTSNSSTSRR